MSPRVKDLSKVGVQIHPVGNKIASFSPGSLFTADRDGGGSLDGGLILLQRFQADIDDRDLEYDLEMIVTVVHRRLAVEHLHILRRPAGPPVKSTGLRAVALDAYLQRIRTEIGNHSGGLLVVQGEITGGTARFSMVGVERWAAFEDEQQRRRSPDEVLPAVVSVYREALADPDPYVRQSPTREVSERLHYSRGHAARLVTQARAIGLLGPANPGRAGEADQVNDSKKGKKR